MGGIEEVLPQGHPCTGQSWATLKCRVLLDGTSDEAQTYPTQAQRYLGASDRL